MDKAEVRDLIKRQRLALCDQLDTLTPDQFEADSLCSGWRVRDVLGHLVSIVELPVWKFARLTPASLDRAFDRYAKQFGQREPWALIEEYRTHADKFIAIEPAGKYSELCDVVTHSLDVCVPLDMYSAVIPEAKPLVLGALVDGPWYTALGMQMFRSRSPKHVKLVAPDIDWSHGDGPEVSAPGEQLILAITGRPVDRTSFAGPGVDSFLGAATPS